MGAAIGTGDQLDALNSEIENRKGRRAELQAEAQALQAQQKALQKRTIALARDLQNIDAERDRLEDRLSELAVSESQLDEALQQDRAALWPSFWPVYKPCKNNRLRPLPCMPMMRWAPCKGRW